MARGILIAGFDYSGAHEDEFHDWYDLEHLPERQRIPGFGECARWLGFHNPKQALATYDLESIGVLASPAYRAISRENLSVWSKRVVARCQRLIRFEGDQINPGTATVPAGSGGILINAMDVAPEHEVDFNAWYDEEHLPALRAVPGTLSAFRYRARSDGSSTHRYVAMYLLTEPEVTLSPAWKTAASSEWTDRLRPHFRNHLRVLARAYEREAG